LLYIAFILILLLSGCGQETHESKDVAERKENMAENPFQQITIENDKITSIILDEQTTQSEKEKVEDLMSKLRSKSKGSKFKKN
jgi:PBP1b-binding outer membrane lipoprotein LpoB